MKSLAITYSDAPQIMDALKRCGKRARAAKRRAMSAASKLVVKRMRADAPVLFGATKASIGTKRARIGTEDVNYIGVRSDYVFRKTKTVKDKRGRTRHASGTIKPHDYAYIYDAHTPWLDASINAVRQPAIDELHRALWREIEVEFLKQSN
ncbi:MAG: hypothetical protein M0O95_04040 [Clostridiales bacterium]|nr:hypothetical protein [Clostridiales bacterium]